MTSDDATASKRKSASLASVHPPLRNVATEELRKAILEGRYKPGARLVEERIAEEFGVSRSPVREALRVLAGEGLIQVRPRRGAVVAELSHQIACEMIEVRATLEGLNARLAARRRDVKLIAAIEQVLKDGRNAASSGRFEQLPTHNARFHDLLAEAGNNGVLSDLMRALRDRTSLVFATPSAEQARRTWSEHEQIIREVIAGDEQMAEMLAARHVFRAGERYLRATECGACVRGFEEGRRPFGCPSAADAAQQARELVQALVPKPRRTV